jgi:hypothetical protein
VSARLERSEAIQAQFQIGESNVRWVPAFKTAAINHLSVRPDSLHAGSGLENNRLSFVDVTSSAPRLRFSESRESGLRQQVEGFGMKFHHLGEMGQKITDAVIAGVQVILVSDALLGEFVVEYRRPLLQSVIIFLATIEID